MKASTIAKLGFALILLLTFRQTVGQLVSFAGQLDRVTAEKVSQLEALGN